MSGNKYVFQSERLGFRNWTNKDIAPMTKICADEEVMRFFPSVLSSAETAVLIEKLQNMYHQKNYTYFAVDTLIDQQIIGFIGLCYQDYVSPITPCVDIGWRLSKSAWNKGYATEGAKRSLKYAFEELQIKEIFAIATSNNLPSINVMKKIGMKRFVSFKHPKLNDHPELVNCLAYQISNPNIKD